MRSDGRRKSAASRSPKSPPDLEISLDLKEGMTRALERVQQLLATPKQEDSPYSLQLLLEKSTLISEWLQGIGERGSLEGQGEIVEALQAMEREANTLLSGEAIFRCQLERHLKSIRERIHEGVRDNLLSSEHPELFEAKIKAIEQSADTSPMDVPYREARALDQYLQELVRASAASRALARMAALRRR